MVTDELLGPFVASGDMLLAMRAGDSSLTGRDERFRMLSDTMKAAGVDLDAWDWIALRRLADQDGQAAAAIARWISRARLAGLATGIAAAPVSHHPDNHIGATQRANTAADLDPDAATTREEPSDEGTK